MTRVREVTHLCKTNYDRREVQVMGGDGKIRTLVDGQEVFR